MIYLGQFYGQFSVHSARLLCCIFVMAEPNVHIVVISLTPKHCLVRALSDLILWKHSSKCTNFVDYFFLFRKLNLPYQSFEFMRYLYGKQQYIYKKRMRSFVNLFWISTRYLYKHRTNITVPVNHETLVNLHVALPHDCCATSGGFFPYIPHCICLS